MFRFRREVGSGTVKALTLLRAAQRIERSLVTGSHAGGCGFCTGCGNTLISFRVVVEAMIGLPIECMSGAPTLRTSSTLRPCPNLGCAGRRELARHERRRARHP